jgi:hypothetical protein
MATITWRVHICATRGTTSTQHLADHFTHQQVGQQTGLAPAADDDQLAAQAARFVGDFLKQGWAAPYFHVAVHTGGFGQGTEPFQAGGGQSFDPGRQRWRLGLVFGVADDGQHHRERHAAAPGHGQGDALAADIVLAVLGGQQQLVKRFRHVQCPPVSQPEAASTTTAASARHTATKALSPRRAYSGTMASRQMTEQPASTAMPARPTMSLRPSSPSQPQPVGVWVWARKLATGKDHSAGSRSSGTWGGTRAVA